MHNDVRQARIEVNRKLKAVVRKVAILKEIFSVVSFMNEGEGMMSFVNNKFVLDSSESNANKALIVVLFVNKHFVIILFENKKSDITEFSFQLAFDIPISVGL
jgi:hypothetical protein